MSGMIVAWRDEANQASDLRVQRIDFQGNRLWSLEGLKITAPVGPLNSRRLRPRELASIVMAWPDFRESDKPDPACKKSVPDPALNGPPDTYASDGPADHNRWNPVILGDDRGGAWVAWEDFRNRENYQIEVNHLGGAGVSLWHGRRKCGGAGPGRSGEDSHDRGQERRHLAGLD